MGVVRDEARTLRAIKRVPRHALCCDTKALGVMNQVSDADRSLDNCPPLPQAATRSCDSASARRSQRLAPETIESAAGSVARKLKRLTNSRIHTPIVGRIPHTASMSDHWFERRR